MEADIEAGKERTPGIIIQARLGSSRLPGKVLLPIAGRPVICHVIQRCIDSGFPTVLAVPDGEGYEFTNALAGLVQTMIYEGHPTDVLDRYYEVAKACRFDPVVRVTGDCPLIEPVMIREMVESFLEIEGNLHYMSNRHPLPVVPSGMDVEIFTYLFLELAHERAWEREDREHVTRWMYKEKPDFCSAYVPPFPESWKMSIDTQVDYERVKAMVEEGRYPWLN